jgi:hypothetical protein
MANEMEFIEGFFAKAPHANAPDFVKAKVNIKREDLLQWLSARQDEWINIDIKEARSGKWYASVDNWQPSEGNNASFEQTSAPVSQPPGFDNVPPDDYSDVNSTDDDIPF